MDQHDINFLKEQHCLNIKRRQPSIFLSKFFIIALLATVGLGAILSFNIKTGGDISAGETKSLSLFATLRNLISSNDSQLKGEENDRVNFLLLGVGGAGHDGPELTDTIIFASLRPSDKSIGIMSIPRDLTVPVPGEGWRKINAVNALAEAKKDGSGPTAVSEVIKPLFNQEINYYIKVDFDGFAELIDELDGLDIYVENSFTDPEYPVGGMEDANCGNSPEVVENSEIENFEATASDASAENSIAAIIPIDYSCRFEVLSFQQGWMHMNGATALKYVRSRHGTNGEASDFARSRRQQILLLALKEKILSLNTLRHPSRISAIFSTLGSHIQTNLSLGELITLGTEYANIDPKKIVNQVLDTSEGGPLYATSMNGAYVILPKNDDWAPLQQLAANIFSPTAAADSFTEQLNIPRFVKLEIQNGTAVAGLAFQISQILSAQGFEITQIGNAEERNFTHTIIYDLTNGKKADELKSLQELLSAEVAMSTTGWVFSSEVVPKEISVTDDSYVSKTTADDIDFLIILGEDSSGLVRK